MTTPKRYRTIVADPPWPYTRSGGYWWRKGRPSGDTRARPTLSYATLGVDEIAMLPVVDLAEPDAHLYLWTTQRFLLSAHTIAQGWGFAPSKVLVWCKPPTGFSVGGAYGNACEFVLFARRGRDISQQRVSRDWWEWPRSGGHSAKPEAFLDLVEQVSPGPYLELFARRDRLGWDTWGDESLGTAELAGAGS